MSSKYSVEIRDNYGRLVTTILRPQNKTFSTYRNKPGSCRFTMDLLDLQCTLDFLKVNQYDIVFKRLGTPLFGGQISYLNPTIDGDKKQLQVTATGWFDLLDYRYIYEGFPDYNVVAQQIIIPTADSSLIASSSLDQTIRIWKLKD